MRGGEEERVGEEELVDLVVGGELKGHELEAHQTTPANIGILSTF